MRAGRRERAERFDSHSESGAVPSAVIPFGQFKPGFAHDEGEGDRSLAVWRAEHERNFGLACERIHVIHGADVT